jgi:hypothetical protein
MQDDRRCSRLATANDRPKRQAPLIEGSLFSPRRRCGGKLFVAVIVVVFVMEIWDFKRQF